MIKVGSLVSRNSYGNDVVFKVTEIKDGKYLLKGVNYRLEADSDESDLKEENNILNDDEKYYLYLKDIIPRNTNEFFYIPGKVLHLDGDEDYLNKCLKYYKESKINVIGKVLKESKMPDAVEKLLKEYNPDILVITGHDAYYKKRIGNTSLYKNSNYFIEACKKIRKNYGQNNLIIIAGACQSDYENLIKAGATYASSPKKINIHALDPAIIAVCIGLWDKYKDTNIVDIVSKTKYGKDGMGGVISKGTMLMGYPREMKG